jgi:transcriptional regulator with XRE-family HTH domain
LSRAAESMGSMHAAFAAQLRELRAARRMSLADLSAEIHFSRGYVGNVETGVKFPDRRFAELAECALRADGTLISAWERADGERREAASARCLLTASLRDSESLVAIADEPLEIHQIHAAVERLAIDYLGRPPAPMLAKALHLRAEALQALRTQHHRPSEHTDLYLATGRLSMGMRGPRG